MKKFILLIVLLVSYFQSGYATPPREMQLTYDPVRQSLLISLKHPTSDTHQHYIRELLVSVNHGDPQMVRLNFQKAAWGVEKSVPLSLKPGDTVTVTAKCIKGGSAQAELVLHSEEIKDK